MRILTWNTAHGRGSTAALQLADRVHCDGLLVRPFAPANAICEVIASDFIHRHSDHNAVLAVID